METVDGSENAERRRLGVCLVGSVLTGIVAGLALSSVTQPPTVGMAAGLFGGSVAAFFAFFYLTELR